MAEAPAPLTVEELAALDAAYQPFPAFAQWPRDFRRRSVWTRRAEQLEALGRDLDEVTLEEARNVAARAAAWDTGAIEGLYTTNRGVTLTIATQAAAWEQEIASHGAQARDLFDAQLATYELVMDVATQLQPVTQAWIRRLHEELTSPQDTYVVQTPSGPREEPLPRGQYKPFPNHVQLPDGSRHAYAPVSETQPEMDRLVSELTSAEFADADPVIQASYAHYALTVVHPFADGNGRVARALASVYLYRAARVPLIVFADDREPYLDSLATADRGRLDEFVEYLGDAAIGSVELVTETLKTRTAPSTESAVQALRELLTVQSGLTYTDLDGVANSLLSQFHRIVAEEITKAALPNGVSVSASMGGGQQAGPPDGYRAVVAGPQFLHIVFSSPAPSAASRTALVQVFVTTSRDEDGDVFWLLHVGTQAGSLFAVRDLHPRFTAAAEHRVRMLAQRILGTELTALQADAEGAFRESGYATT